MDRGDFDAAIYRTVDRLIKKKKVKDEELQRLADAYQLAWDRDKLRIQQLKTGGQASAWVDIFEIYTTLHRRQQLAIKVNPLVFSNGRTHVLPVQPIDAVREEARENAASFFYDEGWQLLQSPDRNNARLAFDRFQKVLYYYKDFKDVQQLLIQAREKGTAHILLLVDQHPNLFLPRNFAYELLSVDYNDVVRDWIFFYTDPSSRSNYDYTVKLVITESFISPGVIKEHFCDEEKEIEDGWQYVYDSRGNVMKDSLGNDIKVPKFLKVRARVTETQMFRQSAIRGNVEIYDYKRGRLLKSIPAQGESAFNHYFATFVGDKRALSKESLLKIGNQPLPFPSDAEMILLATNELKRMFGRILRDNQRVFDANGV
jgi:uncharacterized Zn ribbon protein